ncbi:MAG: hypothetical protein KDK12_16475 [Rhodobacteraceae bacterium]|nr:hypothetical protein [Paracoccaceae bacterium]
MLVRVILLFLVFMVVMAMIQKALRPGRRLRDRPRPEALDRLRCPTCKRITLTETPAPCGRNDCRYRT